MLTFRVSGHKTVGESAYSFNCPRVSKEKAVAIAIEKEKKGYRCTIEKDEPLKYQAGLGA